MFKKPQKKNLRQRFEDEGDVEESMEVEECSSILTGKKDKKKKKKEKAEPDKPKPKQTLLSFDEDLHEGDDVEVFQVRKSSHSKKMMRQLDKERKKKKKDKNGMEDTTDTLLSIVSLGGSTSGQQESSLKSADVILNGLEAEYAQQKPDSEESQDEVEEEAPRFSKPRHLKQVLESGCIPDAAMIHAARKSRQKAREMGTEFIPIEDNKSNDASKSRLIRDEDDHDTDEDGGDDREESQRIDFTVDTRAQEQERRREAFFSVQDQEEQQNRSDAEEDEMENWEAQQIRKAVSGAQLVAAQQEVIQQQALSAVVTSQSSSRYRPHTISFAMQQQQQQSFAAIAAIEEPQSHQVLAQMPVKRETAPTPEEIARLLKERIASLRETERRNGEDRNRILGELVVIADERKEVEEKEVERSKRFQFYQNIRGYVTDLVECFNEKVPVLEQMGQRYLTLVARRSTQLISRRRQDVKDQAAEAAAYTRPAGTPAEHDESRVRRTAEREGRRARRRRAREQKNSATEVVIVKHFEGYSTDDEQPDLEVNNIRNQIDQIKRDAHLLFNDVLEDFSTLESIIDKFEQWKGRDIDSYKEAYVHLSLPKIVSPIVQLQLLTWNPLEENCVPLESCPWFQKLALYSTSGTETEESLEKDPDLNLIPLVVELAVITRLTKIIADVWDPCSSAETSRLTSFLRQLLTDYPHLVSRGRVSKCLLPAVVEKLKDAVDNDVFIPIYPSRPAAVLGLFLQRQFWSAVKLLRNVLLFRAILSDSLLLDLAMTALLGRYLLAALRTCEPLDALEKSRHIKELTRASEAWMGLVDLEEVFGGAPNTVKGVKLSSRFACGVRLVVQIGFGELLLKSLQQFFMCGLCWTCVSRASWVSHERGLMGKSKKKKCPQWQKLKPILSEIQILAVIPRAWLQKTPQLLQLQLFSGQVTNIVKAIDVGVPGGRDALMEALTILKTLGANTKAEELGKIYL